MSRCIFDQLQDTSESGLGDNRGKIVQSMANKLLLSAVGQAGTFISHILLDQNDSRQCIKTISIHNRTPFRKAHQ